MTRRKRRIGPPRPTTHVVGNQESGYRPQGDEPYQMMLLLLSHQGRRENSVSAVKGNEGQGLWKEMRRGQRTVYIWHQVHSDIPGLLLLVSRYKRLTCVKSYLAENWEEKLRSVIAYLNFTAFWWLPKSEAIFRHNPQAANFSWHCLVFEWTQPDRGQIDILGRRNKFCC